MRGPGLGALKAHKDLWFGDKRLESLRRVQGQSKDRLTILYALGAYMVHVARADEIFHEKERALIREILAELNQELQTGLSLEDLVNLMDLAEQSRHAIPIILREARQDDALRYALLRYAWRVAARDGGINELEFHRIIELGKEMGASNQELVGSSAPYYRAQGERAVRSSALKTLELGDKATAQQIEDRYRELSFKFHPDNHPQASVDLRKLLCEKFAVLGRAYAELARREAGPIFYGKAAGEPRAVSATPGLKVECFFCERKWQLPEGGFSRQHVRCGNCQALLLFESDLTDIFLR